MIRGQGQADNVFLNSLELGQCHFYFWYFFYLLAHNVCFLYYIVFVLPFWRINVIIKVGVLMVGFRVKLRLKSPGLISCDVGYMMLVYCSRGLHGNGDGENPADSVGNSREWG